MSIPALMIISTIRRNIGYEWGSKFTCVAALINNTSGWFLWLKVIGVLTQPVNKSWFNTKWSSWSIKHQTWPIMWRQNGSQFDVDERDKQKGDRYPLHGINMNSIQSEQWILSNQHYVHYLLCMLWNFYKTNSCFNIFLPLQYQSQEYDSYKVASQ